MFDGDTPRRVRALEELEAEAPRPGDASPGGGVAVGNDGGITFFPSPESYAQHHGLTVEQLTPPLTSSGKLAAPDMILTGTITAATIETLKPVPLFQFKGGRLQQQWRGWSKVSWRDVPQVGPEASDDGE